MGLTPGYSGSIRTLRSGPNKDNAATPKDPSNREGRLNGPRR